VDDRKITPAQWQADVDEAYAAMLDWLRDYRAGGGQIERTEQLEE
jgi:hypothetical protein